MPKLKLRQKYCLELIKRGRQFEKDVPKLDFEEDEFFPGMANILEFQHIKICGEQQVTVFAKCDIDIGKVILVEDAFITSLVMSMAVNVCSSCFKTMMNFIPCNNCNVAMFCSQTCAENDKFHDISCGYSIRNSDHLESYTVRSVLLALSIFAYIDNLIKFVKGVLSDE